MMRLPGSKKIQETYNPQRKHTVTPDLLFFSVKLTYQANFPEAKQALGHRM